MIRPDRRHWPSWHPLETLLLPALAVTIGLQCLRMLFPSIAWYLKDTLAAGSATLGLYALGTFAMAFLAIPIWRALGARRSLFVAAALLAVARLVEQMVHTPAADLWLSMAGSAAFLLFIPIYLGCLRSLPADEAPARFGYGLILGLAVDTTLRGLTLTLDLSWIPGIAPLLLVAILCLCLLVLCWRASIRINAGGDGIWSQGWIGLVLGPFLLLQALVFQNQGWVAEIIGLSAGAAFAALMGGNLALILGLLWGLQRPRYINAPLALALSGYLVLAVATADLPGRPFLLTLIVAQLVQGWGWSVLARTLQPDANPGLSRTTISTFCGMLLFLILAFAYYISLDIPIPIARTAIPPLAAAVFGIGITLTALDVRRRHPLPIRHYPDAAVAGAALLAIPLLAWAVQPAAPQPAAAQGYPIRVMTYNIHSAFNLAGRQDPEAIAAVIEQSKARVVTLQEVSRGWLIDGSTDLVAWLARRLRMQVLFQGTTDPVWGNAILTSYPIIDSGHGPLPLAGTLMARGYLWAQLDVGGPEPLLVIATHLHQIESEHQPRLQQVPVLLQVWNGAPSSLLMGDLNSLPDFPEMDLIRRAGMMDSWEQAGEGPGLTLPADTPIKRIDWVWHSPDLRALQAVTVDSTASDHRPVIVTLAPAR
jgi:endonuclease/exonuclease/phosphatase family metal-dependent hydrolase